MNTATAASSSTTATSVAPHSPAQTSAAPEKTLDTCVHVVTEALTDLKAKEILTMDVAHVTDVTDRVVIANGTSNRHVRALADHVAVEAKKAGFKPLGVEGEADAEWVLVDLGDVVVHVMLPAARKFYDLESLWRQPEEAMAV